MENNIQAYLERLGLKVEDSDIYPLKDKDNTFIIPLSDSDDFARTYSKLENADWLTLQDGDLSLQDEFSSLLYINDEVAFTLKANLINNTYSLEVEEL